MVSLMPRAAFLLIHCSSPQSGSIASSQRACMMLMVMVPILLTLYISSASALGAPTDTYTWSGSYMRHGYQTNHNMDPSVVESPNFGQLFMAQLPGNFNGIGPEQIYSQPLVFTGNDGVQYLYVSTTQNNLYKINAKTGTIVTSRNLHVPFLQADLDGCTDIEPTVGITATGTIDPSTGIWYLTSKTYSEQFQSGMFSPTNTPGRNNGRYYFHGIDTQSANLTDIFPPVMLDGRPFRNNPRRIFQGGIEHSRPALVLAGDYVYTGYASHCVQWNFTGAIIGHNRSTGAVVEMFATEGGPEPITVSGGGVWMSGGGISYDGGGNLYFATGNGYASQLSNTPVPGRQPPTALEEAAVNAKINDDGTLTIIDFFMPWEKTQLDGADKDLGTTPLELLPTDVFTCPNVKRMGVVTGKSGKTYVINLDNMGGYQMGVNRLDDVVFMYQNENSVYAGAGVMPLGGGYIYINIIRYQTRVFKFSCDGNGNPQFTVVSYTAEFNAYILGTGHGTTTSLNGQDGTGIFWVSDVEGLNLRIYNAIPPSNGGNLTMINSFNAPHLTKFTRPVFGDGIVYLGTTVGAIYAFGSPVNLPLNCSSPYNFGKVALKNSSSPVTITCIANIATTVTGIALAGNPNFNLSALPGPGLQVAQGSSFSFQAVFDPQSVGPLSSDAVVNTTNSVAGYSSSTPVTLEGIGVSIAPLLTIGPNTVSFNVIADQQAGGVNQSAIFSNLGNGILTIKNISYSLQGEKGPWVTPNVTSAGPQVGPFTFISIPTFISGNGQSTVTINFNPTVPGNQACFLSVSSDGGTVILDVLASAGTYPRALIEFEKYDGTGWTKLDNSSAFTFGNVTQSTTRYLQLRVTNDGGVNAVPLSITVSKPPVGAIGIVGANNGIDLGEGTIIAAGQSATATLYCSVPKAQYNTPSYYGSAPWIMNTADPSLGKQFMKFGCTAVAQQVGPLFNNGSARFGYLGCYREDNPGRQMAFQAYGDSNNTVERCVSLCYNAGWEFSAVQYTQECWCGDAIPIQKDNEVDCNYQCTGNDNETCGGDGYFADHARMSLFADLTVFQNVTSPPFGITPSVGQYNYIGCYSQNNGKAMNLQSTTDTKLMTVEACATFCKGYNAFSLEFSQECYCGNSVNAQYATLTADSNCMQYSCKGNNSESCGAANMGQIYSLNGTKPKATTSSATSSGSASSAPASTGLSGWVSRGCWTDNNGGRALDNLYGDNAMTLELCASTAGGAGTTYFGLEYGSECWYGSTLKGSNAAAPLSDCNFACPGNSAEICGAGNRLSLWQTNSSSSISSNISTSLPASSMSSVASASATTSISAVPSAIGNYTSLGCYTDNNNGIRALPQLYANDSMTLELCIAQAQSAGAQYAGASYGRECWYGPGPIAGGNGVAAQSSCNMKCPGNQAELCGAGNFLQMYNFSVVTASSSSVGSVLSTNSTMWVMPSSSSGSTSVGRVFANLITSISSSSIPRPTSGSSTSANSTSSISLSSAPLQSNATTSSGSSTIVLVSFNATGAATATTTVPISSNSSVLQTISSIVAVFTNSSSQATVSSVITLSPVPGTSANASSTLSTAASANSTSRSLSSSTIALSVFVSTAPVVFTTSGWSNGSSAGVITSPTSTLQVLSPSYSSGSAIGNTTAASRISFTSSANGTVAQNFSFGGSIGSSNTLLRSSPTTSSSSSTISSRNTTSWSAGVSSTTGLLLSSSRSSLSSTKSTSSSTLFAPSRSVLASSMIIASSSVASGPTPVSSVDSYTHVGCYNETSGRTFNATSKRDGIAMTVPVCASFCSAYALFGVEYGGECYCGPYVRAGSGKVTNQAECNMPCAGDKSALCGGPNRLNVYSSSDTSKVSTDPISPQNVGYYKFYHCVDDSPRLLGSRLTSAPNMTVEMCMTLADRGSFTYAGLEYGVECWAGNALLTALVNATSEGCNMPCGGDVGEICGAGSRLSLYQRTA